MEMIFNDANQTKRFVLIVDDEFVNREILGNMIEDEYHVLYAVNGREAMETVEENKGMLSAVLLDLNMPEMNGYEVMKALQERQDTKQISIIVLTSEDAAEVECLKLGASDFIKKPYEDVEVIRARIRRCIELSEDRMFISASERDELTGLYTKTFFYEYAQMMDRYHPDLKTDAVILNIEHFHLINEIYGREMGDRVLLLIADKLKDFLKEKEGIACRSEADVFFLYVEHQNGYDELVEDIQEGVLLLSNTLHLRLRVGVYAKVEHDIDMEQRFSNARYACNTLRGNYMRYVAFYDMTFREHTIFLEHLVNDIYDALEEKQFLVYLQPKYNVRGEEPVLCGAEALVRWQHPRYGLIAPKTFLSVFEENGLISRLDHYVCREVAGYLEKWQSEGMEIVPVSVNFSRIDFYDPKLSDILFDLIEEHHLEQKYLHLEVTESAYISDVKQMTEAVELIREDGFVVEMDDFGSGYSSLNSLTSMPVDVLKMDREFIAGMEEDVRKLETVKLVMQLARFMEVPVVAEGVEIAAQYDLLVQNGCDMIQGYYFSKPVPPEEFEEAFLTV